MLKAVDALPLDFRMVVILADLQEFSYREIADILDVPVGTVMSRLYRGRRLLQKALAQYAVDSGFARRGRHGRGSRRAPPPPRPEGGRAMTPDSQHLPAMDCAELERSVEAYLDGEFEPREQAEAEAHLAGCERCRLAADAAARVRSALRARLREAMGPTPPAGRAPEALRRRVYRRAGPRAPPALAPPPRRRCRWPPRPPAPPACWWCWPPTAAATRLVEEAVRKHHRGLPLEVTTASVGAEAIPGWFAGKLDFKPTPPRFQEPGPRSWAPASPTCASTRPPTSSTSCRAAQAGLFIVDDPGPALRGQPGARSRSARARCGS